MANIKMALRKVSLFLVPHGIYKVYARKEALRKAKDLYEDGEEPSYCPTCGNTSYFSPFGVVTREKAQCILCESLERHRLVWLFLQRKTNFFENKNAKILHVAPEPVLEAKFKKIFNGSNYITADLMSPYVKVKMDITDIKYPDESFDVVICNHVLEHVPDDRKAMSEFFRVLKKGGWALLLVPKGDIDETYEDFSIKSKHGRLKAFGQIDHVRKYGRDYIDRLIGAGFKVTVSKADDVASPEEVKKMRLKEDAEKWGFVETEVFYCTK